MGKRIIRSLLLLFFLLSSVTCQRWNPMERTIVVARSAGDHHANYLRTEFRGVPSVIINRLEDGRSWKDLVADGYKKLPVSSRETKNFRKPWINFTIPKDFEGEVEFISDAGGNGRECSAYLFYLIKNYHQLPDFVLFSHGEMQRIPKLTRQYFDSPESHYQSFSRTLVNRCFDESGSKNGACYFKTDFKEILSQIGIDPPKCVTTWCCNYFLVHKSRVLQHPIEHYHKLLDFALQERKGEPSWKHGCFYLEHFWHVIFGEPADMYLLKPGDNMNGDCMVNGDSYTNNPARPNPFNKEPYFWHKPYNTW